MMKEGIHRTDFITGLTLFFLAAGYGVEAWRLPRVHLQDVIDSHVYPMVLASVLGLLALGLMAKGLRQGKEKAEDWLPSRKGIQQIFFLFLALIAYIVVFQKLGYLSSTFLFMVVILKLMHGKHSSLGILALSLLISGVCYLLFVLFFKIQVPAGILI